MVEVMETFEHPHVVMRFLALPRGLKPDDYYIMTI